ncbi:MAG: hypothetical protein M3R35_07465 [Candidatus Eremiobacteraeota bacterium]|nr:hypothetical protein [Candidatus Eremiobacteraeota bacterium]
MTEASGRTIVHLIEPQQLFVPALVEVFSEAGLAVDHVAAQVDPRLLLEKQPDLVFLDTDYINEPLENVRLSHVLLPQAQIFVYATAPSDAIFRAFTSAGADVVLEKSADRRAIVQALYLVERKRRQRHVHDG